MPSLLVTSVLYHNDPAAVDRLVASVVRAVEVARERGVVDRATYRIGDCSDEPVLDERQVKELLTAREGTGVDEIRYEFYAANLGSAEGNNRLFRGTDADYVLMVNPDVYASPLLVVRLAEPLADPTVGIADARQLPFEHPKAYDPVTGDTGWASMACCLLRGDALRRVGDLDGDTFFLYCDDVDYSWRTRLAGYRVVHQPAAVAFHDKRLGPDGTVAAGAAERYYAAEAALLLTHKYSRDDLTRTLLRQFAHGPEHHRRAREEYLRRKREHRLPAPLDAEHRVAEFVAGNYAPHRF